MKKGIWHLTSAINQIDETIGYFMEYANSGSKYFWDMYVISHCFFLNYAIILDEKAVNNLEDVESICDMHPRLQLYHDYQKKPDPKKVEKVISILYEIQKRTEALWVKEVDYLKVLKEKATDEEYIKGFIQYDPEKDSKKIVPWFIELSKRYLK